MKFYLIRYYRPRDQYPHTRVFYGQRAKEAAASLRRELDADEKALNVEMLERTRPSRIRSKREGGRAA